MGSIVGFSVFLGLDNAQHGSQDRALKRVLNYFPWLKSFCINIGESCLHIWGHGEMEERIFKTPNGGYLLVIGSPSGHISHKSLEETLLTDMEPSEFKLPWDGRIILVKISADGRRWTMWNDWNGSIPVFHAQIGKGRIASTLEPLVVAAAGYTPNDFFFPGLVSLLINGHYLGDWTLFKAMKVVRPDCVAEWNERGFHWRRQWTVKPSDTGWDRGWDELVDEMYELSYQAIAKVLKTRSSWILPLSGGIDSRLIAAVGADLGTELRTYTYGHHDWIETVYGRQVARALAFPWQRVPIKPNYLVRYTRMWLEWFGSALHCHGMYQMPFLKYIENISLPIVTGYIGDPLAGAQTRAMCFDGQKSLLHRLVAKWKMWDVDDALSLFKMDGLNALEEINDELQAQFDCIPGASFQKIWFLFEWNHVFGFSYYQPMMYDYWKGCETPYVNKEYAQFTMSLSRLGLEDRLLQIKMLRRYYSKISAIGGTYGRPLLLTKSYIAKKAISKGLPRFMCKGSFREFSYTGNTIQIEALRNFGEQALWPLNLVRKSMGDLFNLDLLEQTYQKAVSGDESAYKRLRPIQTIAWHFVQDEA